jgi:hypothetical protein
VGHPVNHVDRSGSLNDGAAGAGRPNVRSVSAPATKATMTLETINLGGDPDTLRLRSASDRHGGYAPRATWPGPPIGRT